LIEKDGILDWSDVGDILYDGEEDMEALGYDIRLTYE